MVAERNDAVLLVRQYRLLLNDLSWEIPGGRVEESETVESAIMRECLEETGYMCRGLKSLIKYEAGLDTRNNPTELFYSSDITRVAEPTGEIEQCHWVPLDKCFQMMTAGEIVDVFTISGLMAYKLRQQELPVTPRPQSDSDHGIHPR